VKLGQRTVHARYYTTITFNQMVLTPRDRDVAMQLINVYFDLFKHALRDSNQGIDDTRTTHGEDKSSKDRRRMPAAKENGQDKTHDRKGKGRNVSPEGVFAEIEDSNTKLMSAILTGVNRALPFVKVGEGDIE
jgi:ribosome biogenesis protein MAK21